MNERDRANERLTVTVLIQGLVIALLSAVLLAQAVRGAEQRIATPADATGWALADVAQLPELDRPFARYLWIPSWGNETWVAALNYGVNTAVSHAQTLHLGTTVANGWMVRYDLRRLCPRPEQLAKAIATWDGLALHDPYFHVPDSNIKLGVAVVAPHLEQAEATLLADLSLSAGAVYRADWFLVKALSTLNGGAYYDFRQVERQPAKGTPLDNWLSKRGLFVATTQAVGGERRAAMFRSGVTGKSRRVDLFPTLAGGLGSITRDVKDGNVEAGSHPLRNLLAFSDDGSEIIVAQPNGMLDYLLADSKGNIVDEAPPDLVRDHTIPPPHTARLQPARSCISCHSIDREDGWRTVTNDVKTLLGSRLNVFADFGAGITREEAVDKLAGFYALDVEHADGLLGRARRDHSAAVFRSAAGLKFDEQKSFVSQVGQLVTTIIHGYDYDLVTPEIAARELGSVAKESPLEAALGAADETTETDPIIGFLRIGVGVNRSDWETVYADAARVAEIRRGK